jgi:hypothetical protein
MPIFREIRVIHRAPDKNGAARDEVKLRTMARTGTR